MSGHDVHFDALDLALECHDGTAINDPLTE